MITTSYTRCTSRSARLVWQLLTRLILSVIQSYSQNPWKVRVTPENPDLPALDPTTPWYEWHSYLECCNSLGVTPSLQRFIRYNNYYKSVTND